MRLIIRTLLLLFFLNSCATVQTKVDEKTQAELDKMGKFIGYSLDTVYIDFGNDGTHSTDYKGYKKVTFTTKKLGVKCRRIFFYDRNLVISSIKFAGCW